MGPDATASEAAPTGTEPDTSLAARFDNLTLWQKVHDHLRQQILTNALPPGTVLQELALAQSLGVSRGPIREALGRLAAEGLVVVRPRRGAIVASLSKDEFLDAYQVREALETLAIRLAIPKLSHAQRRHLEELVAHMAECAEGDDIDGFFTANAAFHLAIVEASGNARLQDTYRQLVEQMGRYRLRSLQLRGNLKESIAEHRRILRAVNDGHIDEAAQLVAEHIRLPQRRIESTRDEELFELGISSGHAQEG
jgi:DNA-binding GntR family transcriptional regulator